MVFLTLVAWLFGMGEVLGASRPFETAPPATPAKAIDRSQRPELLSADQQAWLERHPNIRLAPSARYEPLESFDRASHTYSGLVSEYFTVLEGRLGRRFDYVLLTDDQWAELDPIRRGADVITASAMTRERTNYWIFTKPFLSLPTYVIARRTAEDGLTLEEMAGARVAVVRGWAAEAYLREMFPDVVVDPVLDVVTGLRKASFGLVDAFVSELPVATEAMEREGITNLKILSEAGYTYQLAISVRKDWPELRVIFDQALETITPGERASIYKRWVKIEPPVPRDDRWRLLALWSGAGLLLVLGVVMIWNRSLTHTVRARTADVRAELARRIEADKLLAASEEKFSKVFRSSPLAICLTRLETGEILEVNAAFLRMFGHDVSSSVVGQTTEKLGWWVAPEARATYVAQLQAEGRILNLKRPFRRADGQPGTGLFSVERVDVGGAACAVVLVNDITERERAEDALRASEELFATTFHSNPNPNALIAVPSGEILDVNPAFTTTFGYGRDECVGRTTLDLNIYLRREDRERLREKMAGEGSVRGLEMTLRHRDGHIRIVLFSGQRLSLARGPCALLVAQDVTERTLADAERQLLLRQLHDTEDEERRRIARELHDTTAQHLAAAQMNLTRLQAATAGGPDQPALAESLRLVAQSVREIRTLTYLLHPPMLEELGLAGALVDYARGFAKRSGLHVEVDTDNYTGRLPHEIELTLFRVAQESLTNVLRHSGSPSVVLRLDRDETEVRLEIQDSGRGLPSQAPSGVGLRGMRERLRQIGGQLDIESEPAGTTVLASVSLAVPA